MYYARRVYRACAASARRLFEMRVRKSFVSGKNNNDFIIDIN